MPITSKWSIPLSFMLLNVCALLVQCFWCAVYYQTRLVGPATWAFLLIACFWPQWAMLTSSYNFYQASVCVVRKRVGQHISHRLRLALCCGAVVCVRSCDFALLQHQQICHSPCLSAKPAGPLADSASHAAALLQSCFINSGIHVTAANLRHADYGIFSLFHIWAHGREGSGSDMFASLLLDLIYIAHSAFQLRSKLHRLYYFPKVHYFFAIFYLQCAICINFSRLRCKLGCNLASSVSRQLCNMNKLCCKLLLATANYSKVRKTI